MNKNFVSYEDMTTILTQLKSSLGSSSSGGAIVLSDTSAAIYIGESTVIYAVTNISGNMTVTSSNTSIATASVLSTGEGGTAVQIDGVTEGNANITFSVGGVSTVYSIKINDFIWGVEWDGSPSSVWTRTDSAVGFEDPNPYYSGMTTTPSSPFDNIMPWSGIRIVEDASAGTLVEIPKFWYKWTRTGDAMKLQISNEAKTGFYVSPAHADRGDGVGERDYVYVGRYHCNSSYKSVTGTSPITGITRATARTNIHNLGSTVWQWDYAMYWTICMLYLVEYANWNSQTMIGSGCGNNSAKENVGASDTVGYHTGTAQLYKTTYGVGTQYRYIEDLWGNVFNFIDGIRFVDTSIYAIKNPSYFSDTSNGSYVGSRTYAYGNLKSFGNTPTASGLEYALYPSVRVTDSTYSTYMCDIGGDEDVGTNVLPIVGYGYSQSAGAGLFTIYGNNTPSTTGANRGTRLMALPPSRLSST